MYLSPPISCYQRTSRSHIFSSFLDPAIHTIASVKPHRLLLANPQNFLSSKILSTLWKYVGCVWVQIFSQGMAMGEGRRRCYNDFSLRMSSSLSKRWMCCVVENRSKVFHSKWSLILLWVMRVYIVWVKGKKVTLKNLQAERFASILWEGLTSETVTKLIAWHDSSVSSMYFSCVLFAGYFSRELITKLHWFFISCSILHQLNTKPNTIKSHKIQRTKLKQLQHFLSCNKANIKHSCKLHLTQCKTIYM